MGWQDDEVVQSPSTQSSSWKNDEIVGDQDFLSKTAKNIIPDLKQTAIGIGSAIKEGAFDMPKRAIETGIQMAGGVPYAETPSGKQDTEFVKNAPAMGKEMARPVTHPIDYFQEHPVQQSLNAIGAFELGKGMLGKKPPLPVEEPLPTTKAETPPDLVPMRNSPEAPREPISRMPPDPNAPTKPYALFDYNDPITGKSSYQIFGDPSYKTTPNVPFETLQEKGIPVTGKTAKATKLGHEPLDAVKTEPPPQSPVQEAKDYVNSGIGKAKEFLNKEYAKQAKDPGWANTMAQYLQQESQNLAAKELGASAKHVRQIGEEGVQALGQYAIDKKIVDPRVGSIGMKERVNSINKTAGKVIGDIRKQADTAFDPVKHTIDVIQPVRQALDAKFEPGMPGASEYQTAMRLLEKSEPTPSGVSETVTKLNDLANESNKLKQPSRPYTDVANIASRLNNERIKAMVGPEKAAIYDESLKDFGATKKLQEFLKTKAQRAMGHGSAGSATNRLVQKFLETAGYKAGSRIAGGMAKKILASPKTAGSLPEMFKEFINQVEALDDDITPHGMSDGGMVPDINEVVAHHIRKEKDPDYRNWVEGY